MISTTINKTQTHAITSGRRSLALLGFCLFCCLLLALGPLPSARGQRVQQAPVVNGQNQYQLMANDALLASQLDQATNNAANLLLDQGDAALMADLLNSFSERRALVAPAELNNKQQQQQQHGTPGHYEFEVAPKMEPPSAPRPPFKQANHVCPGSDLFAGFSPKNTLCGDLYQGRVPLNPMGQSVNEQAYPFELIKNKTLQFLAKSLPILKTEYETIPKVARYLPANQLLNPTSLSSPLGHEHFHELNQNAIGAPPFLRRRRRKRDAQQQLSKQHSSTASITVAEMQPNATLVVSSAHSAGRIGGHHHFQSLRSVDAAAGRHPLAMITKDGFRPIGSGSRASSAVPGGELAHASVSSSTGLLRPLAAAAGGGHADLEDNNKTPATAALQLRQQQQQVENVGAQNNGSGAQRGGGGQSHSHAALTSEQTSAPATNTNGPSNGVLPQSLQSQATGRVSSRSTNGAGLQQQQAGANRGDTAAQRNHANSDNNNNNKELAASASQLQARSSAASHQPSELAESVPGGSGPTGHSRQSAQPLNGGAVQAKSAGGGGGGATSISSAAAASQQHLKCANVNGLFLYTVCQAASALVEGDSAPGWLQAARQIGTLYSAASSADSYGPSAQQTNPIWSLWNAFAGSDSRSSEQSAASSGDLSYKSSSASNAKLNAGSSVASMINLLNPLMSFFAPSLQRTSDVGTTSVTSTSTSSPTASNKLDNNKQRQSFANNLKTLSNVLLTGLSLAGLYDWLGSPTSLFTPTATTFAKRKKTFDPSETFVDTPASLAAMASAKQLQPGALSGGGGGPSSGISKQPPTPCPSVEEYISPTFARNYQGAWKYVVQIPHEGYFTQTIQRSSCMRQKCEFTEGVCHEAPRWVSLLVAEIYYPNAIFGSAPGGVGVNQQQQQQQAASQLNQRMSFAPDASGQFDSMQNAALLSQLMAASPSTNNLQQVALNGNGISNNQAQQQQQQQQRQMQPKALGPAAQDPLQMTDSLNTYNHNLNNAFFSAATELGLDPTNVAQMQQLANAHNYQLMQRNGLLPGQQAAGALQQQQPQLEARVSQASQPAVPNNNFNMAPQQQQQQQYKAPSAQYQNPQQQQQLFGPATQGAIDNPQQVLNNDYIKALAIETLRQNPHLSVDDLIKSLQLQQARKKRDLSGGGAVASNGAITMTQSTPSGPLGGQQAQQQQLNFNGGSPNAAIGQQGMSSPSPSESIANGVQGSSSGGGGNPGAQGATPAEDSAAVECDGHDKIGCYVVRVYYDWFLVNGSCKCWKTSPSQLHQTGSSSSSSTSSSGGGNASGSFIRRIFTG